MLSTYTGVSLFKSKNVFCPALSAQATKCVRKCCTDSCCNISVAEMFGRELSSHVILYMYKLDFVYRRLVFIGRGGTVPFLQPLNF